MIELSACHVVWAYQGGCCLFPLSSPDQEQGTLTHVWTHLSSDLHTRVLGLVAPFALNVVGARPENPSNREEARYVDPATHPQHPS
jgi:hypothetical protein